MRPCASSQLAGRSSPFSLIIGPSIRASFWTPLQPQRPTSQIQVSFTSGLSPAVTRLSSPSRFQTFCRQPTLHNVQGPSTSFISQTRAVKRYLLSVSAPTGQISITLPETMLVNGRSANTPTSVWSPRLAQPNSPPPSISVVKRMQRVQCTQRFISGLIKELISFLG